MRVLVLGGTGSIGGAVVDALIQKHVTVWALSRSSLAATKLIAAGATPIPGDICRPQEWIARVQEVDAVVHAAATWGDDMDAVDQALATALLNQLKTPDASRALIYTGGCWLYGNTGNAVATENSPLSVSPGFSSAIHTSQTVLANAQIRGMVIHPAMVYERGGGIFENMYDDINRLGHVRIYGSMAVRWPLVHRIDLAQLYVLMLFKGKAGDVYNASAIDGVKVGDIARAISDSTKCVSDPVVHDVEYARREFGDWAEGYALDQQMSGQKARTELGWQPGHVDVFSDIY